MTTHRWAIEASTNTLAKLSTEMRNYFRGRVHDTSEAEDLVSQLWLAAGRTFEGRCTLRHYLYSIGRRMLFTRWRRLECQPWILQSEFVDGDSLAADVPDLEVEMSNSDDMSRFYRAVSSIPAPFREPVEMTLCGYGFVEMAELMGVNYNTLRSRFFRGKKILKELLEAEFESDVELED